LLLLVLAAGEALSVEEIAVQAEEIDLGLGEALLRLNLTTLVHRWRVEKTAQGLYQRVMLSV
jgi:hypothetical protein